jgi:hypothetical protein
MAFEVGDRIEMYPGESHSFRADVLKVAKNGSVKIERWFSFMHVGEPKRIREWLPASVAKSAVLIRGASTRRA